MSNPTEPHKMHLGMGGLSGIDGSPVQEPEETGYHPEPSLTGAPRGPAVPSSLPEHVIIERIEKGNISEPETRWWQPKTPDERAPGLTPDAPRPWRWSEIMLRLEEDPKANKFFERMGYVAMREGVAALQSDADLAAYLGLEQEYHHLMQSDPDAYLPPESLAENASGQCAAFMCFMDKDGM